MAIGEIIASLASLLCVLGPAKEARPDASYAKLVRISAVMWAENSGQEYGVSKAGALGPMQIMPIAILELQTADGVPNTCRPPDNWEELVQTYKYGVHWGTCYLEHLERLGFTGRSQLVAYNWGPSGARKWRQTGKLPKETVGYIQKIEAIETACLKESAE